MIICPRCQSQNQDGAPWCQYCGQSFTAYPPQYQQQSQYPPQQIPPQSQYPPQQQQYYQQPQYQPSQPAPAQPVKSDQKKRNKVAGCLIAVIVICVILIIISSLGGQSDDKKAASSGNSSANEAKATATVNYTKQTVEAYPLLGAEYKAISNMTDIQKEPYIRDMMGKEYRIIGGITEVNTDGTIQLQLKNATFMAISMVKGYPADRLTTLTKDDTLDFIGKVSETSTLLYLNITTDYIRDTEKY